MGQNAMMGDEKKRLASTDTIVSLALSLSISLYLFLMQLHAAPISQHRGAT